jgi:predicted helicase
MKFNDIIEKYRSISHSERDKGDRFERLMQGYLLTDPKYAYRFKQVWLWDEFPGKKDLGGFDTGIDLVALTHEGDYWAVQCKCYQPTSIIDKPAVDSFLSTSSREFLDENLRTTKFSVRLWISTTNKWGPNAEEAIRNQNPPVVRIHLTDLQESPIDWENLEKGIHGEQSRISERTLKPHQQKSMELTHEYFKTKSRGKLIMACGTGKTFNSLRIAENETNGKGTILFLVPSIALLGQTLREWTTFSKEPINPICICSDPDISKKKTKNDEGTGYSIVDLALPASTNVTDIIHQFKHIRKRNEGMTVVFSTYQSIEVISRVQKELRKEIPELDEFDMIICDEAHRTTGVTLSGDDESAFTKVHDDNFIKSKKRLYMTATPRLYSDETKSKAAQSEAVLCSMDDDTLYGEEIYRIGFGEAVEKDLLTDYKVLILTLSDRDIPPAVQKMISDEESEINTDDASKLIGCINALSKQVLGDNGLIKESDPEPMRSAVAFCSNISTSRKISATFNSTTETYITSLPQDKRGQMVSIESKHIDGTMSAPSRDEMLGWLKNSNTENECRILTNVKVLSEGVDVPSLDAVLFLSARNSQVDVVQSVGRVMRKSPGKKYGYIIIPVVVPSNVDASSALDDNERYKVVWTVLNALRAHDDRFNATVNKIELNKKRPNNILVGRPEYSWDENGNPFEVREDETLYESHKDISRQMSLQFEELQNVVFARMVEKVGDRRYWEQWAKNVAEIAERQVERISRLIQDGGEHQKAFDRFLGGLRKNINPSITEREAVDMLSQHIITKPVFDALFEGYSFVNHNPISVSMQKMLDLLEEQSIDKDTETLEKFYESVKMRAQGIDNGEGKQRIIIELYDKFFKTASAKMVEKLGIVYTPIECVDFILFSVNDILIKEFGRGLTDENIHLLDPFTGTGTFITRLLQSGLIEQKDLERKYKQELHANEIVLLAYYIAAINIENSYHDQTPDPDDGVGKEKYTPFDGIVLTDTFQLGETEDSEKLFSEMFPQNSKRVQRQRKSPLRVIVGNPPYSVGQKSTNDNAQNQSYFNLDKRISNTYGKLSGSTNMNALYDSYIKSFRWSTDRLDKNGGIICFVSNGAWIDGNSTDGFRKSLEKEFTSIYIFNLRGNARTSGELRQKEGGGVFGLGSRTPISITLLVKNPDVITDKATIYYHDIGDYLNREEKLSIVKKFKSVSNPEIPWKILEPNEHGDWISQRNDSFNNFTPIEPEKKFTPTSTSFFTLNSLGSTTNRDAWSYGSSKNKVNVNIKRLIEFYNQQVETYIELSKTKSKIDINEFIDRNPLKISWTSSLIPKVERRIFVKFEENKTIESLYRPFFKQKLYFGEHLVHRRGQFEEFFPEPYTKPNFVIFISGVGVSGDFSCLISKCVTDGQILQNGQCFPLYYYEENKKSQKSMFDVDSGTDYLRRDGISDFILERARKQYGAKNITKEDIFFYVYGFLHSPEYRETFSNDLKKMLPRLPLVDDVRDFWSFSKSGRELAELHLNYEQVPRYDGVKVIGEDSGFFRVEKMRFPKKDQKDTIIFNSKIVIQDIPMEAYDYVVNGKSAIEWIMERYQITTHKESQITNDPNDWSEEEGNPRYILDLLLSVINVSMKTREIVQTLPKLKFD